MYYLGSSDTDSTNHSQDPPYRLRYISRNGMKLAKNMVRQMLIFVNILPLQELLSYIWYFTGFTALFSESCHVIAVKGHESNVEIYDRSGSSKYWSRRQLYFSRNCRRVIWPFTEKRKLSWCQLCRHCRYRRLSLWRTPLSMTTKKWALWQFPVFNALASKVGQLSFRISYKVQKPIATTIVCLWRSRQIPFPVEGGIWKQSLPVWIERHALCSQRHSPGDIWRNNTVILASKRRAA